jgi:hypothetical protein
MRDILILNEVRAQDKIYFGGHFNWLKYEACFVSTLIEFIRVEEGMKFMKLFLRGGASFGTSDI